MISWECTNLLKRQKLPPEVFRKKGTIFIKKHLYWSLFGLLGANFIKKNLQHIFFCEYYEIFKNTY